MGRPQEEQHGMVPAKIMAGERQLHDVENWMTPELRAMVSWHYLALVSTVPGSEMQGDLESCCELVAKPRWAVGPR